MILKQKYGWSLNEHSLSFIYFDGHSYICDMGKDFRYNEIANGIAGQIKNGILKSGDRLPSLRVLCEDYGVSMNTAKRVMLELAAQSLVDSKPMSGYFVSQHSEQRLPLPGISRPSLTANDKEPDELISKVYANLGNDRLILFSIGIPSGNLLPLAKLKKEIIQATRTLNAGGAAYESLQGNIKLRRMIAARSLAWGGNFSEIPPILVARMRLVR